MRRIAALFAVCISLCLAARADTVILSEGASYTGQFVGMAIRFTDQQGIQYTLPRADVQTLVFNATSDTVTLRNGKSDVGHLRERTRSALPALRASSTSSRCTISNRWSSTTQGRLRRCRRMPW